MKRKAFWAALVIIVSWGLEYAVIRYGALLQFRLYGFYLSPLFLAPAMVLFDTGSIRPGQLFRTVGLFRWWLFVFFIPLLLLGAACGVMTLLKITAPGDAANPGMKALTLFVNAPLGYIQWIFAAAAMELCWRVFLNPGKHAVFGSIGSSLAWFMSGAGFLLLQIGTKEFSFTRNLTLVSVLIPLGIFQSMVFNRSGSVYLAAFSLFWVLSIQFLLCGIPFADAQPLFVPVKAGFSTAAVLLTTAAILGLTGLVLLLRKK